MAVTDGSGDGAYHGMSADIDTMAEWATEFARWESIAERNSDVSDELLRGSGHGLPGTAKLRVAHADAAATAGDMVTVADRLWSGAAAGIAAAARDYSGTDAEHGAALEALRRRLDAVTKGK